VSRRRLIALAATCAAGALAIPGTAHAAGSTPHPAVSQQAFHRAEGNGSAAPVISGFSHPTVAPRSGAARTAAASTLGFSVNGESGSSAYDVKLSIDVTGSTGAVTVTPTWDGVAGAPISVPASGVLPIGNTFGTLGVHKLTLVVTDQTGSVSEDGTVLPGGSDYTAYGPARLLDTRSSKTTLKPYSTIKVQVGGNSGISVDALAAVLNLTVTNPTASGYLTAYPDGIGRPGSSNVNFTAHQTVPNLAFVPVGTGGYVDIYNGSSGTVDLIADISGYFSRVAASGYTPAGPARLVDTRNGTGASKAQIAANGSIAVQVDGRGGVPASGVTAVALNITATGSKSAGFLTAYPDGNARPTASNVNYGAGQTIANAVVVPVGADGKIRLGNGPGQGVNAVVDVTGYYSPGSKGAFMATEPSRVYDTRTAAEGPAIPGYTVDTLQFGDGKADQATAYVLNATVPQASGPGYLAVTPDNGAPLTSPPGVSTLNFTKGQTVPNLVQATTGSTGGISFWNASATANHLVLDEFGYYLTY
jgi:hypothetical protein